MDWFEFSCNFFRDENWFENFEVVFFVVGWKVVEYDFFCFND